MKLRITIEGRTWEVDVEVVENVEDDDPPPPYAPYPVVSPPPRPGASTYLGSNAGEDARMLRSPVTGLVIRVEVEPGQEIEAGQPLLVLEAMKMETQMTAPRAARVKQVLVAAGDSVKLNQLLMEFE